MKLQDGKVKNTPFTSPPNTTVTFAEAPSDKRLDVESLGGRCYAHAEVLQMLILTYSYNFIHILPNHIKLHHLHLITMMIGGDL